MRLAFEAGVGLATVHRYEAGNGVHPKTRAKLARALTATADEGRTT